MKRYKSIFNENKNTKIKWSNSDNIDIPVNIEKEIEQIYQSILKKIDNKLDNLKIPDNTLRIAVNSDNNKIITNARFAIMPYNKKNADISKILKEFKFIQIKYDKFPEQINITYKYNLNKQYTLLFQVILEIKSSFSTIKKEKKLLATLKKRIQPIAKKYKKENIVDDYLLDFIDNIDDIPFLLKNLDKLENNFVEFIDSM